MSDVPAIENYIVYLAKAAEGQPAGTVVNIILYDGAAAIDLPEDAALAPDPARQYPIGSIYTPPSSSSGE